ncbi:MAG: hypothetical protein M3Y27_09830, partial [Acidobacteriota bacterium]|nr:hypothetical protein [Acidobacteriota bacterium]
MNEATPSAQTIVICRIMSLTPLAFLSDNVSDPFGSQEFSGPSDASRFCFVIDHGLSGAEDPHVEFLRFDKFGTVACRWVSDTTRVLYLESEREAPVD